MIRNGKKSNTLFLEKIDYINKYKDVFDKYIIVGEWKGCGERVETRCKHCGLTWNAIPYNLAKGKAKCPYCEGGKTKWDTLYLKTLCEMNGFELLSECNWASDTVVVKHKECGTTFPKNAKTLTRHWSCPNCNVNSRGEFDIKNVLSKYNINFKREITFHDLKGIKGGSLRFDFGVYSKDNELLFIIEYDGNQHEEGYTTNYVNFDAETTRKHDKIKNEYCKTHNIDLYRINYHNRRTVSKIVVKLLKQYMLIPSQDNES